MKPKNMLRKAARSFAKRQHLVILGDVDGDDAHQPIKGFMLLPKRTDSEFASGHVQGIDISLVVRSVNLPGDLVVERLTMEFHTPLNMPHVIALSNEHDEEQLKGLLASYYHYQRADIDSWRVFTKAESLPHVAELRDMLHALSQRQVNDAEFEGNIMRLYLEKIGDESDLDAIFDFVRESVELSIDSGS